MYNIFFLSSSFFLASSSRPNDVSLTKITHLTPTPHITIDNTNSNYPMNQIMSTSFTSDVESYNSAILPALDKNLLITDSSSYASIQDQSISTSSSYHTAVAGDTTSSSSMTGYETPTPQLDDGTLSSHSSISDLSHADTLEPNVDGNLYLILIREEIYKSIL